ncbi:hypothetical protein APHAL10511_002914 [Amanita phalloides]|nr:hypothetical protein APHAL10511_002914 [Amanita phalloides]
MPASLVAPSLDSTIVALDKSEGSSFHTHELSPLCVSTVPATLCTDTAGRSSLVHIVQCPGSESSRAGNGDSKDTSGSHAEPEEGELESSESSIEIYLSSLGLENTASSKHISTVAESEKTPVSSVNEQQQTLTKVDENPSPQLPPAPLQQTIPLPDVPSDCEGQIAPKKIIPAQPVTVSSPSTEIASGSIADGITSSDSRDIYLKDCINLDNSNKTANVYINGLPPHFPEERLYALAAPFGPIRSVRTFTRHVKESESGYGFVLFETVEAAEKCIMSLRRYRNLHPTFSKQVHKIPGITYTHLSSAMVPNDESAPPDEWVQSNSEGDVSFKEKMESLHDPTSTNLYMEGLPLSIDEATLAALVSPHRISSSRFFQTRLSNPPRIIAFVRLETRAGAEEIIERLHGRMVRGWNDTGSRISVRFADTTEQRELRRTERATKEGDQSSSARLTIAQAALLNMRGQELRQRPSPLMPAHQSLPDRLDRLRGDNALYPEFPNVHLSPTGLTVDYSLTPNTSYVSPRLHTSVSAPYVSSQQRGSIPPSVDPTMLSLLDSLRGSPLYNGEYAGRDSDIQYNVRPQIPSRLSSHALEDFGYVTQQQFPLRNGYTPTEEYIMRAHAESAAQRRRPPPLELYRRRKDSDASITLGVRGQRAQASSITIPQQKTFSPLTSEVHNAAENDLKASAALGHELRLRPQQMDVRQDNVTRHDAHSHANVRSTREPVPSKNQQVASTTQQLSNDQYPAGHTRCSTLPHRSSSTAQYQRHYQHSSMSVPGTGGMANQDAISAILSSMNSNTTFATSKTKASNNDPTTDHATHDLHDPSQLKITNRLSYDNVKGATQLEKHSNRRSDSLLNSEIEQPSSSLTSPALTYSSHTPSTLSPATPFFGSFANQSDGFEQHGADAKKPKVN